jgi:hypothetical protein
MEVHSFTELKLMAERLKRSDMRFRDQDLRRHADGHYVWLECAEVLSLTRNESKLRRRYWFKKNR